MQKLKVLDLFSGSGAMSLGLERAGMETVAFCEIHPPARRILAKQWPEVPCHDDVSELGSVGPVDLVAAGFPCQDISLAGEGAGLAGNRSGLFWHVLRTALLVGQPRLLLENVAALLGRGMDTVLGSMASLGYDAEWDCIRASQVGLPQERDRIWIVADTMQDGKPGLFESINPCEDGQGRSRSKAVMRHVASSPFEPGDSFPQPLLRRVDDRPANWVDRVEVCGNAVVPQIPELIGNAILETMRDAA